MFKLNGLKSVFRPVAFSAVALGAIALSAPAGAAPFPLFSFAVPPAPSAPPVQAAPEPSDSATFELPARFKRQIVSYSTQEAPGTLIIDTPHTYLYYVLGGGQAMRYGIGVGREGFTWSGVQSVTRKA